MKGLTPTLIVLLIFLSGSLFAQQTGTFITMSVSGKVSYREAQGAELCELLPTQVLGMNAVITVSSGASARLMYEGNSIHLNEAGNYPLKTLAASKKEESSTFMERFFNYIYDGVVNTSGSKNIEEYHQLYVTQSSGGIKGFAGSEYGVSPKIALTGNLLPNDRAWFEWFSAGDSILYDLQIIDYQTEGVMYKALMRDTSVVVDLAKLAFEPGRKYYWFVQQKRLGEMSLGIALVDDPSIRSPKMEFVLSGGTEQQSLRYELEQTEEYKQASPTEQRLMLAQALEDKKMIYAAQMTLLDALGKDPENNALVKRVYGAFLIRQGLWEAAKGYLAIPN